MEIGADACTLKPDDPPAPCREAPLNRSTIRPHPAWGAAPLQGAVILSSVSRSAAPGLCIMPLRGWGSDCGRRSVVPAIDKFPKFTHPKPHPPPGNRTYVEFRMQHPQTHQRSSPVENLFLQARTCIITMHPEPQSGWGRVKFEI